MDGLRGAAVQNVSEVNGLPLQGIVNVFVLLYGYFGEPEFYFPEAFVIDVFLKSIEEPVLTRLLVVPLFQVALQHLGLVRSLAKFDVVPFRQVFVGCLYLSIAFGPLRKLLGYFLLFLILCFIVAIHSLGSHTDILLQSLGRMVIFQ